jgi:hypothetical protein
LQKKKKKKKKFSFFYLFDSVKSDWEMAFASTRDFANAESILILSFWEKEDIFCFVSLNFFLRVRSGKKKTAKKISGMNFDDALSQLSSSGPACLPLGTLGWADQHGRPIGDTGASLISAFARSFEKSPNTKGKAITFPAKIDLARCSVGDTGAEELAQVIIDSRNSLKVVMLQNNKIGDDGAIALATALEETESLVLLCLEGNNIGRLGIAAIEGALR